MAASSKTKTKSTDRPVGVGELLLLGAESGIGGSAHPYLLALLDNELVVYRAFRYRQTEKRDHLQLRFSKVLHTILTHRTDTGKVVFNKQ